MIPKQTANSWNSSMASLRWLSKKVLVATVFFNRGNIDFISSSSVEPETTCAQAIAESVSSIPVDFVDWGVAT